MKLLKKLGSACLFLFVAGVMSACGSMFPTAPAERAIDKVLDDVLAKKPKQDQVATPERART